MFYDHLQGSIEALLFSSGQPLSAEKIAGILQIPTENVINLIGKMQSSMMVSARGLVIVEVVGGYQICTKPDLFPLIEQLAEQCEPALSIAALETLSIVAFKQPITRQEVELIRGVRADRVLNTLLERRLIKEIGRKEAVGRPILFGTTDDFLACFGLKNIEDLPNLNDIITQVIPVDKNNNEE